MRQSRSQAEDLFFRYAEYDPKDVLDRARRAVALDAKAGVPES